MLVPIYGNQHPTLHSDLLSALEYCAMHCTDTPLVNFWWMDGWMDERYIYLSSIHPSIHQKFTKGVSVQCIAQYSKADNKSECNVGCWFPYIFHPSIHPSIKNSPYISLKGTWCSAGMAAMHSQNSRDGTVLACAAGSWLQPPIPTIIQTQR